MRQKTALNQVLCTVKNYTYPNRIAKRLKIGNRQNKIAAQALTQQQSSSLKFSLLSEEEQSSAIKFASLSKEEQSLSLRVLSLGKPAYDEDFLILWSKSTDFISNEIFTRAYICGMNSGHKIGRPLGSNLDIGIKWRVATACWAAHHASLLPGDFVECGVNTGIFSLAICDYLNFNALDKSFWLFDTYEGIPVIQMSKDERSLGRELENEASYYSCYEVTKKNFAPYPRAQLIKGMVPDTLKTVSIEKVSYLSLDMNIAEPERAAIEFFWPKLVPGAIVLLDDYGWMGYREQKTAHDAFAKSRGVEIMTLPTGQGLLIKP